MMSQQDQFEVNKQGKGRKNMNAIQIKNQRITRRMNKIINNSAPFSQGEEGEKCAICLSECGKSPAILPCSHVFCLSCIANWWVGNQTCPYCRKHFQFVLDSRGRKLGKAEIPENLLIQRQETLKCQSCWADIQNDPMRICYECRCVYMHKRCMLKEELKQVRWRCQQCLENEDQEIEKTEEERQMKGGNYTCSLKFDSFLFTHRHSQRLMMSQIIQKQR